MCFMRLPPNGSFFSLDGKETKDQGFTAFAKNQSSGPEIKELAVLKQLLFLSVHLIDFFNANPVRPSKLNAYPLIVEKHSNGRIFKIKFRKSKYYLAL